jgi:superfamily II DNA helicase RecQ
LEGVNDSQKKESPLQVGRIFQGVIHQMMPLTENFDDNTALHERLNKGFAWFLNRTVELLQDLIDEGLPDIDNQATKEQMEREFELLSNDYNLKIQILTNCLGGFSLDAYWDAKALASMNADNPKAAKKKMPKAPKEKAPEKVKVAASDDIKNPKLYDALREWRMKKAYQLKVPPYSILHNSTLVAITNNLPANQKELIAMPGIGKRSMEAFGNELLELVKNYRNT